MTGKPLFLLLAVAAVLAACGKTNVATVRGTFSGIDNTPVYLSRTGISTINRVDTVTTGTNGDFRFEVELTDNQPVFYNLRCKDQTISLLLAPGEHVEIRSLGNLANNYLVEGSVGSQEIKELNELLQTNRRSLDSLAQIYLGRPADDPQAQKALNEYSQRYIRQKQGMISFIVNHATSLSAIYALYQRMPNGEWFFGDGKNDAVYFRMVADSLAGRYPTSPHVLALQRDLQQLDNNLALSEMINSAATAAMDYPDLDLPDALGNRVRLSSLTGQVILLDFWVSTTADPLRNADLLELYNAHHAQGFEIYQVALDTEKLPWITAVQQQRLPWISVNDLKGTRSPAVLLYNVTQLPANVLINRAGEISGRDLTPEQLEARIPQLL